MLKRGSPTISNSTLMSSASLRFESSKLSVQEPISGAVFDTKWSRLSKYSEHCGEIYHSGETSSGGRMYQSRENSAWSRSQQLNEVEMNMQKELTDPCSTHDVVRLFKSCGKKRGLSMWSRESWQNLDQSRALHRSATKTMAFSTPGIVL
jgi:hypothetical protein